MIERGLASAGKCIIAIDASRSRSGGAIAHLIGFLRCADPARHCIDEVHLWASNDVLDQIDEKVWLVKHSPRLINWNLFFQIIWQVFLSKKAFKRARCSLVLNTDAGSVGSFSPAVTMSRDMLSFEPGISELFGFGRSRIRLFLLKYIQIWSLNRSAGSIFLTRYAHRVIRKDRSFNGQNAFIPHGVDEAFRSCKILRERNKSSAVLKILYVSNLSPYKNQIELVRAIKILKDKGLKFELSLVGGGDNRYASEVKKLIEQLQLSDCIVLRPFLKTPEVIEEHKSSDIFVFASSCENLPNTLLEAMASGLPIVCSNRGPMPEVLGESGLYFDPKVPGEIAEALERLIISDSLRRELSDKSFCRALQFSWERCSRETFEFLTRVISHNAKI